MRYEIHEILDNQSWSSKEILSFKQTGDMSEMTMS